jgi:predicted dehydrogenase
MSSTRLRIGLIGAGANTRERHIPGLRSIPDVEIVAVCNRRPSSTQSTAQAFGIARRFDHWQDLVSDPAIDAIVIGTWPYLHCPITLAALEAGKHVLTEARMSMNADEAHRMLRAARQHPRLIAQVVPSPYGLKGVDFVAELIESGFLGELREVQVHSFSGALADAAAPLSWRQDVLLSGFNMLTLGILHETLLRWAPPPVRVLAQAHAFIPSRVDPESGVRRAAGTPDSVQVLAVLEGGARAVYHFSGVTAFGQGMAIHLYGTEGTLHYDLRTDVIRGMSRTRGARHGSADEMETLPIPSDRIRRWTVEADFIAGIREGQPIRFTSFETGVAYMEFTEAVARSAQRGEPVALPLEEFKEEEGS